MLKRRKLPVRRASIQQEADVRRRGDGHDQALRLGNDRRASLSRPADEVKLRIPVEAYQQTE